MNDTTTNINIIYVAVPMENEGASAAAPAIFVPTAMPVEEDESEKKTNEAEVETSTRRSDLSFLQAALIILVGGFILTTFILFGAGNILNRRHSSSHSILFRIVLAAALPTLMAPPNDTNNWMAGTRGMNLTMAGTLILILWKYGQRRKKMELSPAFHR